MADSTLRKYIWLINTILDARKITFKEISDKWDISTLNYKGTELSKRTFHVASHSKFFYLLNISELSILKNVTANDLETSYILFLSQLCNIQRTL